MEQSKHKSYLRTNPGEYVKILFDNLDMDCEPG